MTIIQPSKKFFANFVDMNDQSKNDNVYVFDEKTMDKIKTITSIKPAEAIDVPMLTGKIAAEPMPVLLTDSRRSPPPRGNIAVAVDWGMGGAQLAYGRRPLTEEEVKAIRLKKSPPTTTKPMFVLLKRGNKQNGDGKDRSLVRYTPKTLKKYFDKGWEIWRVGDRVDRLAEEKKND